MRVKIVAATLVGALCLSVPAHADPGVTARQYAPPYVDHVVWAPWRSGSKLLSLRVFPTASARAESRSADSADAADEAWAEVLAQAPGSDTPGMRAQFRCHWDFAETAQPGKTSWNLEPWRPVVDDAAMVDSGCNPGGGQEPF